MIIKKKKRKGKKVLIANPFLKLDEENQDYLLADEYHRELQEKLKEEF